MKESLKWMWQQSRGYRWRLALNLLLGLCGIAVNLTFIYVCKGLVDIATGRTDGEFWQQVMLVALMIVLRLSVYCVQQWVWGRTQQQLTNALRSRLFHSAMRQPWHGREDLASGDVMSRLGEDLRVVVQCITTDIPDLVLAFVQLMAACCFLFLLQPGLLWALLCIMPLAVVLSKVYYKTMRRLTRQVREEEADIQSHMQESVQNRALLLSLDRTDMMDQRLDGKQQQLLATYVQRLVFNIKTHLMVRTGFSVGYYTAFVWGAYGLMQGTVTYGMMTAFLQLVGQVQHPILNFSSVFPAIVRATTAAERLVPLSVSSEGQTAARSANRSSAESGLEVETAAATAGVVFSHVTYRYPDGSRDILHDFSYTFPAGSSTAIIGPTGSGKSTLVRLLLGLLQPVSGSVMVGDSIAYVPQGNSLLRGTIRDNLQLGKEDATEAEMRDALRRACALFVYDLPKGLDAPCGEKGSGLSEGQAQRIAIARALLQPGSILVLDEASSALDPDTERQILEDLQRQSLGKTLIWVTHHMVVKDYMQHQLVIEA